MTRMLVEDAAEAVTSSDLEPGEVVSIGDWCRQRAQRLAFAILVWSLAGLRS